MARYPGGLLISIFAGFAGLPTTAAAQEARPIPRPCERILSIVWRVTHSDGHVVDIAFENAVETAAWRSAEEAADHPFQMELPAVYGDAARAFIGRRPIPASAPNPYWTFTLHDPAQPARADIASGRRCRDGLIDPSTVG